MGYSFQFGVIEANFDNFLYGLALGLALAVAAIFIGTLIGLACAFATMAKAPLPSRLVGIYVSAIRNTPLLVIILFVYFALPQIGIRLGKHESFVFSLAIYAGAYLTEVFRAGLAGVPRGVIDAGRAIGLTGFQLALYVISPIMWRNCLPALGTTFISLFKDTSLAAVIAIPELTYQARKLNTETFRVAEAWATASVLYLATCLLIAAGPAAARTPLPEILRAAQMEHFLHELWIARWALAQGLLLTVEISARLHFVVERIIGLFAGIGLTYGKWPLRLPIRALVDCIRGIPVLVLILASFYLLTFAGINLTAIESGLLALSIFCGAHMGEIIRGALAIHSAHADRCGPRHRADFSENPHLCSHAPGDAADHAGVDQYGRGTGQGLDASLGHRHGRTSAPHPGDCRAQFHDPGILWPLRPSLFSDQFRDRALRQICRAALRTSVRTA